MALVPMALTFDTPVNARNNTLERAGSVARMATALALVATMAACTTARVSRAPVEDRSVGRSTPAAPSTASAPASEPAKPPPGAENAGKPGYFTVRPGDTLIRVGLETGQNWKDLVKWNNLDNPNVLEVGQVLRVVPPLGGAEGRSEGRTEAAPGRKRGVHVSFWRIRIGTCTDPSAGGGACRCGQ